MTLRSTLLLALGVAAGLSGCDQGGERHRSDAGSFVPIDAAATQPDAFVAADSGPAVCTPNCDGRECGSDGCGGTCGGCGAGVCNAGRCETSCPANAEPLGDGCVCSAGYAPTRSCTGCEPDPDGDGCPANASRSGGACACDEGYRPDECGCVAEAPACPSGQLLWCDACVDDSDGDGCAPGFSSVGGSCRCDPGTHLSDDGCGCIDNGPDFTHPAFDATSCAGAPMAHDDAEARWRSDSVLASYQLVFRRRRCDDAGCGAWEEVPLTDISWSTRASGVLKLVRRSGVMNLDVRIGLCQHHHYLNSTEYNVGAACSGVGATLTCSGYRSPGICAGPSSPDSYYELLSRQLRFTGVLTDSCVRLQADVTSGDWEGQAALLATF